MEYVEEVQQTSLLQRGFRRSGAVIALAFIVTACDSFKTQRSMEVTVTAYNSVPAQTDKFPFLAAWGDRLEHGMKAVAVSRDLLAEEGLSRGATLRIEGLEGEFVVLDKTSRRFRKRVDIYMGLDIDAAKEFGIQRSRIFWTE